MLVSRANVMTGIGLVGGIRVDRGETLGFLWFC